MTTIETLSLISAAVGAFGLFCVVRAYRQTVKSADPDMDRVRRFVRSAPLHALRGKSGG